MSLCIPLLLLSISSLSLSLCPLYTCSSSYQDTCINIHHNTVIYSQCYPSFYCPNFSLQDTHITHCTTIQKEIYTNLECPEYVDEGDACNLSRYCKPGYYCRILDNRNRECRKKINAEEECNQAEECEEGYVCNEGICVEYFSKETGEKASHMMACKSAVLRNGVCMPESKTIGNPGKECMMNQECIASDGAQGVCICAPNITGRSYCKLHISDTPTKQALASRFSGYISTARLQLFEVSNYPTVQHSLSCYESGSIELKEYSRLKYLYYECSGQYLSIVYLFLIFYL